MFRVERALRTRSFKPCRHFTSFCSWWMQNLRTFSTALLLLLLRPVQSDQKEEFSVLSSPAATSCLGFCFLGWGVLGVLLQTLQINGEWILKHFLTLFPLEEVRLSPGSVQFTAVFVCLLQIKFPSPPSLSDWFPSFQQPVLNSSVWKWTTWNVSKKQNNEIRGSSSQKPGWMSIRLSVILFMRWCHLFPPWVVSKPQSNHPLGQPVAWQAKLRASKITEEEEEEEECFRFCSTDRAQAVSLDVNRAGSGRETVEVCQHSSGAFAAAVCYLVQMALTCN